MRFTPQEMKLIERLRKQERQWCWGRWMMLAVSLFVFACYGYVGVSVYHRVHWEALTAEDATLIAIYWPKILLGTCLGAWFMVWPLVNWRGSPTRMLVLRLLDSQSQKTANESAG